MTDGRIVTDVQKPPLPPASRSGISCPTRDGRCPCMDGRCVICTTDRHTTEVHVRRLPYDEADAIRRDMTPCAAHFACIGEITCQKPGADRD